MKLPNKVVSYNESNISKFVPIIQILIENDENIENTVVVYVTDEED